MKRDEKLINRKLLRELIAQVTPLDEEMDVVTAEKILEQAGADLSTIGPDLKARLEQEVREMRSRNEEVPENLLKLLRAL